MHFSWLIVNCYLEIHFNKLLIKTPTIIFRETDFGNFCTTMAILPDLKMVMVKLKGQWRGALMFSLICARINGWVNNGEAGHLRRHRAHYDVTVMSWCLYLIRGAKWLWLYAYQLVPQWLAPGGSKLLQTWPAPSLQSEKWQFATHTIFSYFTWHAILSISLPKYFSLKWWKGIWPINMIKNKANLRDLKAATGL